MAQAGKGSIKRGKPSYFMSILGVTLVLFLLGIVGWFFLSANKVAQYFKDNITVNVYIKGNLKADDSTALVQYIAAQPYVRSYKYVTKDMARQEYVKVENDNWDNILTENPLPASIDLKIKKEYVNVDSLNVVKNDLAQQTWVSEVYYPVAVVDNLEKNIRVVTLVGFGIAIILSLVVIFLIDNTIRLAMFSNRFLIKTMQMVGATRWFIAKPLDLRAIVNGAVSAAFAIGVLWILILFAERYVPGLRAVHDTGGLVLLFGALLLIGICITLLSTHRSILKYLKMRLDDLY